MSLINHHTVWSIPPDKIPILCSPKKYEHPRTVQNWSEFKELFSDIEIFSDIAEILDELIYNFGTLKQPFFDKDRDGFSAVQRDQLSGGLRKVYDFL